MKELNEAVIISTSARASDIVISRDNLSTADYGKPANIEIRTFDGKYVSEDPEERKRGRAFWQQHTNSGDIWVSTPGDQIIFLKLLLEKQGITPPPELNTAEEMLKSGAAYNDLPLFDLILGQAHDRSAFLLGKPLMELGQKRSQEQSKKGSKKRTRDGLTPEEREERNQKIRKHFDEVKQRLTKNSFATRYAEKYGIKPTQIKNIISS